MDDEKEFKEWVDTNPIDEFTVNYHYMRDAFISGRQSGISQGRREGLEDAAGIAEPIGRGGMCSNVGPIVAHAIRQRIEEATP